MNSLQLDIDFLNKNKNLVAVSGGIDSMVLCHLLLQNKVNFAVAHVNFSLRGIESEQDAQFVESFCVKNNVQFFVKKVDTPSVKNDTKGSIQMIARDLRYQWFDELMNIHHFDLLLTAHHWNDNIETFLMHWMRGSGIKGLLGIPQFNKSIYRPLLLVVKKEIQTFAEQNNINFREDSSNHKNDYKRNFIRNQVSPLLKTIQPNLEQTTQQTHQNLMMSQRFLEHQVQVILNSLLKQEFEKSSIEINELINIPGFEVVLYTWLSPYGFTAWEDIYRLPFSETGKIISSPSHQLLKNRDSMVLKASSHETFKKVDVYNKIFELTTPLKISSQKVNEMLNVTKDTIFVDEDLLNLPLVISNWEEGDYFYPYKGNGKKKLSKFFKDSKLSIFEKQQVKVLKSNNKIVWVIGYRMDNRFAPHQNTKSIIRIEINK